MAYKEVVRASVMRKLAELQDTKDRLRTATRDDFLEFSWAEYYASFVLTGMQNFLDEDLLREKARFKDRYLAAFSSIIEELCLSRNAIEVLVSGEETRRVQYGPRF